MLTTERWARVRALLEEIVSRPAEDRPAYLATANINDPEIRDELESLLRAHDAAGDFLEEPPTSGWDSDNPELDPDATLTPGTRLGSFEILAPLGAGGMGQVYRARDTRLDRQVAVKVIEPDLAGSRSSRQRFELEARAISKLTHPHICVLHDVGVAALGENGNRPFLVMELVEGVTLSERLSGGALPLHQALQYSIEIAGALGAAHTQGIVHRDLKPANIMLTKAGVKLLDFGLARFHANSSQGGPARHHLTSAGLIAGTVPYMSPEQLEGKDVDARADIFSFGAVLYEMVTAHKAFDGQGQGSVISAILSTPYAAGAVTPRALDLIIGTCLAKDPDDRWTSIHDVQRQLQWIADGAIERADETMVGSGRRIRGGWRRATRLAAVVLGLAGLLVLGYWTQVKGPPPISTHRLSVELGVDATLPLTDTAIALSQDATWLAFVARVREGRPMLYVRRLNQLTAMPVDGTQGASTPCFSPDAQWVAFFADEKLKKVAVTGGAVVTLADAPEPRGMWWAEDGTIVFAPHNRMGLVRVSSVGGPTEPLTTLKNNEITHRFPQVLPGGGAVVYTASTEVNIAAGSSVVVQPLPSGKPIVVHRGAYFGRYLASGHIVYVQDDTLFAVPFDARRLAVTGAAGRTIDSVESDSTRGNAQLASSLEGSIVYIRGRNIFGAGPIEWMDRKGALAILRAESADWNNPQFSPDGRRLAMDIRSGGHSDIWVYDLDPGTLSRVTFESTNEEFPVWTADGLRLVYRSFRSVTDPSGYTISWKRADGTGTAQVLVRSTTELTPESWHPTKNLLAYVARTPTGSDDVMILPVDGDEVRGWTPTQSIAFANSGVSEREPTFSHDGKWLAYASAESGIHEISVRPFPGPGPRVIVSSASGETPSWSRTRSELVFAAPGVDYDRVLMVAPYRMEGNSFRVSKPRPWADGSVTLRKLLGNRTYALHPDGARVAIARPSEREIATRAHLTFVSNFSNQLRAIAPSQP